MKHTEPELGGTGPASRILDVSSQWTRILATSGKIPVYARTVSGDLLFDLRALREIKRQWDARTMAQSGRREREAPVR